MTIPQSGGSYVRNKDGSLTKVGASTGSTPAPPAAPEKPADGTTVFAAKKDK